jgi:hypothetical protein
MNYISSEKFDNCLAVPASHAFTALNNCHLLENSSKNAVYFQLKTYHQHTLPPWDWPKLSPQTEVGPPSKIAALPIIISELFSP